jgi:hypothetical protein
MSEHLVYAGTKVLVSSVDDPRTELAAIDGSASASSGWIIVYTDVPDEFTLYEWDDDPHTPSEASPADPLVLAGLTGYWLARGGKYATEEDVVVDDYVLAPATTTENKIPQWDSTQQKLKDGLVLVETIGDPGSHTNVPTERAIRNALTFSSQDITPVEVENIDDPSPELNLLAGTDETTLVLAYQVDDFGLNQVTLYAWDEHPAHSALTSAYNSAEAEEDIPYTVDGDAEGRWVAVAGKYMTTDCNLPTGKNFKINGVPLDITGVLPEGNVTGDIIRWNSDLNGWEVKSEPFEFAGLVLTPALASLIDAEGAIYYKSDTKSVMVCTEV